MSEDLRTAAKWAAELKVPEKKLKDAIKAKAIAPDAKKGACAYYSRDSAQKAAQDLKH